MLISIPVLRMNAATVSSYLDSKVGAVEQKDMVNSGARGTKDRNLRTEVDCKVPLLYRHRTYNLPYHIQVPSAGNLCYWYPRGLRRFGLVAGASSGRCGHARAV
jgi:hypothetical protein